MVVRPVALAALAAALFACESSQSPLSDDEQQGGGASGGTAGASGAAGRTCVPPSDPASLDELGIHARIDGEMNHFVGDVHAFVGPLDPDDAFGFNTTARNEPGVCGQITFGLAVTRGGDTLEVGTYECDANDPHEASGTHIMTIGEVIALSYQGGACTIELSEVGSGPGAEVAGSFRGTLARASGETVVTEGQFRVTITE